MPIIYTQGTATVTIPVNESIAVFTRDQATVSRITGFPNVPASKNPIGTVISTQTVFGPFSTGATIVVDSGAANTFYAVGVAPVANEYVPTRTQAAPVAVDVTGAVSATAMLGGIVTSTTAAAVAGTLPTGAVLDLAIDFAVGDAFNWSIINTGSNTFTVTAATGHTIVGVAAVVTVTSARFLTRKTAADTYITYRIS